MTRRAAKIQPRGRFFDRFVTFAPSSRGKVVDPQPSVSRWSKVCGVRTDSGQHHRCAERRHIAAEHASIWTSAIRVEGERSARVPRRRSWLASRPFGRLSLPPWLSCRRSTVALPPLATPGQIGGGPSIAPNLTDQVLRRASRPPNSSGGPDREARQRDARGARQRSRRERRNQRLARQHPAISIAAWSPGERVESAFERLP